MICFITLIRFDFRPDGLLQPCRWQLVILTQRLRSEGDAPSSFSQPQIDESTSETFPPETFHEQRNYIHIQYIYNIYIYIISYADVYLPVYTYVLKLNTGCTSSVTIASLWCPSKSQKVDSCTIPDQIFRYQNGSKNCPFSKHSPKVCPELYSFWLGEFNFLLANSGCQPQGLPIVHSWTICAGEIPNPHGSNTHKSVYPEQRCRFVTTWECGLSLA